MDVNWLAISLGSFKKFAALNFLKLYNVKSGLFLKGKGLKI